MPGPTTNSLQSPSQTVVCPQLDSGSKLSQGIGNSSLGHKLRQMLTNNGRSLLDECMTIEERKLEKAKVSASYGIFHVHYGVILPIKAKLFGLTSEQESNLDLYRTHMALRAQVDKVKTAFKAYRAARETADNAPLEPATERKEARKEAQAAGYELLERYEDLIKLAIEQAEDHELDKNQYLDDIQNKLSKDYILQTINQIRARSPIERSALDFRDIDITYMHGLYRSLVTNFVSHVHAAKCASGGHESSKEISKAFIQGLASIPELAEGETLSDLYDSLNDPEIVHNLQIIQMQNIENHFTEQLTILLNKKEEIKPEELANIHCHGVNLLSVLPQLTAEKLNALKKINKERKEAVAAFLKVHSEFEQNQQAKDTDYSLEDVETFFSDIGKKMEDVLPKVEGGDETAVGRFATAARSSGVKIKEISSKLGDIEERVKKDQRAVEGCEKVIKDASEEIDRLHYVISQKRTAINQMEAGSDDLNKEAMKGLKEGFELEIKLIEDSKARQGEKLVLARRILPQLQKNAANSKAHYMEESRESEKRIREVKVAPMIRLNAEEIVQIARYFGVENPLSTKSQMAQQLQKTIADYSLEDVETFFCDIGKKMEDVLTEARDDVTQNNTVVGRLAREALKIGELIKTKSNELATIQKQYKKDQEELNECEIVIIQAQQEMTRLNSEIKEQNTELRKMEADINKLDKEFKKFSKKKDLSEQIFAEEKNRYDIERLRQNNLIEKLNLEIQTNERNRINEQCKFSNARTRLKPLKDKAAKSDEQAMKANNQLPAEIRALKVAPISHLIAEEVAQIAKYFGVEKPSSTRSRMTQQLSKTKEAIAKIKEETYAAHKAKIRDLITQLKDQPFTMIKGEFAVNDNLFGGEDGWVQRCIKTQIALNIGIAKEVTRAVAKEVVDQKDKLYQSQQGPEEKRTHMQKRMGQRILPLATKLNIATFSSKGVLNAIEERFEAPLSLAGIEFCANICSKCDVGVPDVETSI
ncbi:MAG TPA: hypothetical protein VFU89_08100 [Rhabdochlamydiaceae bacterium]|nr:hypothetical protein [Rhabdochlamydiaceae bacterium]